MKPDEVFKIAKLLLPAFIAVNAKELDGREGIHLALARIDNDATTENKIISEMIGEVPDDKKEEKKGFAHEKVIRLSERDHSGFNDVCSFETEDIPNKKYGGAIKSQSFYISASGFPPHLDQKFIILLCLLINNIEASRFIKSGCFVLRI